MKPFKNILCAIETMEACESAIEHAITLAEKHQAKLSIVGVIDRAMADLTTQKSSPVLKSLQDAVEKMHKQQLTKILQPFSQRFNFQSKILVGVPYIEIIRETFRNGYDLVIKSVETRDWMDRLFGSNDMHLLRNCPCPVWLVSPQGPNSHERILAAVDMEEEGDSPEDVYTQRALNQRIMDIASTMALVEFAELHVVHVWDTVGEGILTGAFAEVPTEQITNHVEQVRQRHERAFDELLSNLENRFLQEAIDYIKPKKHLVRGWARKEIPALAKTINADLIVMGTVARTGIPGFIMGNTSETILNHINCSVLAIKPPGFESPVKIEK